MKPLTNDIFYLNDDFRGQIAATAPAFLQQLEGLTVFDIKGEDQTRTRVVTTLIHGNEPSGFIASHLWLRSGSMPKTNARIIFCNPESAQYKPIFTRRYVGESVDLNRFFSHTDGRDSEVISRAINIKKLIDDVNPEAIIDLHNTSGMSPAFGIAISDDALIMDLTALFSARLIYTGLRVGTLMEQPFAAPIVTLECGGAHELVSHQVATEGLGQYFARDNLFEPRERDVVIHRQPIRLETTSDTSVDFASHPLPSTDITLIEDIEQFNHHPAPAGEFIGWYQDEGKSLLQAIDENGDNQIDKLFRLEDGRIYVNHTMQMFMATTSPDVATNDCICYFTI
jgi:hypothetical protein